MTNTDKVLDEILQEEPSSPSIEQLQENEILEPLIEEIELITNPKIMSFVRSMLLKAGPFWYIPASFSAEYHPPDERGQGGNVLHTKRVVRACQLLADSFALEYEERDLLYAAALIHDITKGVVWESNGQPSYDPMHPYTVERYLRMARIEDQRYTSEFQSSTLFLDEESAQAIMRLVRCHMGVWSPIPETYPMYSLEMILHSADHLASHLHWIVDGEELAWRWMIPAGTPE